jgi:hypothetical protein
MTYSQFRYRFNYPIIQLVNRILFRKLITACKSQDTPDINRNYDASNRPAARLPTGGATVHGVSDNAAAINIAEIARGNTRHSIYTLL